MENSKQGWFRAKLQYSANITDCSPTSSVATAIWQPPASCTILLNYKGRRGADFVTMRMKTSFVFDSQGVSEKNSLVLEDATCIMKMVHRLYPERGMLGASELYATFWTQHAFLTQI